MRKLYVALAMVIGLVIGGALAIPASAQSLEDLTIEGNAKGVAMATALASIPSAAQKDDEASYAFGVGAGIFGGQHAFAGGVSTSLVGLNVKAGLAVDGEFKEIAIGFGAAFHF